MPAFLFYSITGIRMLILAKDMGRCISVQAHETDLVVSLIKRLLFSKFDPTDVCRILPWCSYPCPWTVPAHALEVSLPGRRILEVSLPGS